MSLLSSWGPATLIDGSGTDGNGNGIPLMLLMPGNKQ